MGTKTNKLNNLFTQYADVNDLNIDSEDSYSKLLQNTKKQTMEDTHTRMTFLVKNELKDEFNDVCKGQWGLKTKLINKAIESMIEDIKNEQL